MNGKKRLLSLIACVAILLGTVAVPAPAQAAEDGYWELTETESYGNYSYNSEGSKFVPASRGEKTVEPGKCTASGWRAGIGDENDTTNTAVFTSDVPADSYRAGEVLSINATIEASHARICNAEQLSVGIYSKFVTNPIGAGNDPQDSAFRAVAEQKLGASCRKVKSDDGEPDWSTALLTSAVFSAMKQRGQAKVSGTFEIEIPEKNSSWVNGTEMAVVVWYHDDYTKVDGYNIYRYTWVEETEKEETEQEKEEVIRAFRVNGFVENAAYEEMGGVSVEAELIDLKNTAFNSPAFAKEHTRTDDTGMFYVYFAVPDEVTIPAVRVTVTLQYLDTDMKPLLRFIDAWDAKSLETGLMMIQARVALSADENIQVDEGQIPTKHIGLSFANLLAQNPTFAYGEDASDYRIELEKEIKVIREEIKKTDPDTGKEITVREEENLGTFTAEKRMADASLLYKTARDAHRFASEWLGEAEAMRADEIRIRLRDREATNEPNSWFRPSTLSILLEAPDCVRDDNGIAVLLHELGHATDYLTGRMEYHVPYYEGDKNHGGIFNATMADSYIEGFATFFASMVKKYMSYPGDARHLNAAMSFDAKAARNVYANNGLNEEIAVAAFLYSSDAALGGIKKLWPVLNEKRAFFKDHYDAILDAASEKNKQKLESIAESMYLYTMPVAGNGKYDPGEPFQDADKDWEKDADEAYYDLPFTWKGDIYEGYERTGELDEDAWENAKDSRVFGLVQDKARADSKPRYDPPKPDFGYLSLGGEEVEYVLVTVRPEPQGDVRPESDGEDDAAFSELRKVWGGEVFLIDPRLYTGGTVTVSVPGGGTIYEGSIEALKETFRERGKDEYLALAYVTADQLASADVIPVPTYGDPDAPGYVIRRVMTEEEIVKRIEEGVSGSGSGENGSGESGSGENGSGESGSGEDGGSRKNVRFSVWKALGAIALAAVGAAAVILIARSAGKRKRARRAASQAAASQAAAAQNPAFADPARFNPYPQNFPAQQANFPAQQTNFPAQQTGNPVPHAAPVRFCAKCGTPVTDGARFCFQCGAPVGTAPAPAQPKKQAVCPYCGSVLTDGTKICPFCNAKLG